MTEMDDDRDEFGPQDAGDPAAAFDALRETVENLAADLKREMTTIRKGVEAAFEEFDRQSPILRQGAQHYAAVLERSGEGLVRTAVQQLERQASDLERISSVLASHNKSAFHRKDQDFRMWMAGGIGIIAGAFLLALLPRFLPFSADSHVAALVMGNDRINAAYAMINSVDPIGVKKMQWGAGFYEASGGEISACLEKARQTAKDQKCNITVPAPKEGL